MKYIVPLLLIFLFVTSCTKTITNTNDIYTIQKDSVFTNSVSPAKDTPTTETIIEKLNDTIKFTHNKNINYTPGIGNYKGQINVWLNSDSSTIGVTANLYFFLEAGSTINILTPHGLCFKIDNSKNENALTWYYNIVYQGYFNGNDIFNVTVYSW